MPDDSKHQARFFDIALDLLCILDASGKIQHANPAFKTFFGAHIQHKPLREFICEHEDEDTTAILNRLATFTTPVSFECRFTGPDKTLKWYLWTLYPQPASAQHSGPSLPGAVFHAVGRDITPYKDMENRELERNIFAEALLDTVLAINASLSLEQVLERILSNIGKVVAYDYVNILLVDGGMAEVVGIQTKTPHIIKVNLNDRKKVSIQAHEHLHFMFTSQECIIVPDIVHPPSWMRAYGAKDNAGSFLGAPIVVESKVIGFLGVFNSQEDFFTLLHAQQLMTFANQVGIAIINARLYEQSQSAAILRERQRVAKELHDSVNQELFAASTYADLLTKAIHTKPDAVQRYASDISHLIRGAVEQMRMILIELHPDTLTKTTLPLLLKQLGETFSTRTGISVHFQTDKAFVLEPKEQVAVYRIVQEVLHNIDKHAQANNVSIEVQRSPLHFAVIIQDDGIGFTPQKLGEFQFGVRGMHERAASINAGLTIESRSGHGTKITLKKDY